MHSDPDTPLSHRPDRVLLGAVGPSCPPDPCPHLAAPPGDRRPNLPEGPGRSAGQLGSRAPGVLSHRLARPAPGWASLPELSAVVHVLRLQAPPPRVLCSRLGFSFPLGLKRLRAFFKPNLSFLGSHRPSPRVVSVPAAPQQQRLPASPPASPQTLRVSRWLSSNHPLGP